MGRSSFRSHRRPLFLGLCLAWLALTPGAGFGQRASEVDWPQYGLNNAETHFSPLKQIDASNVKRLGLAWSTDLGAFAGQLEGTPIMLNGVIYTTTPWSVALAIDARTGKVKWRYDPKISHVPFVLDERGVRHRQGPTFCCGPVNRGVAYDHGKIFFGTLDNRLIALDAETGKPVWSTAVASSEDDYTITGAPRVIKGKVIIGEAGAELGVRGFVAAYDADMGKQAWRFYIVPGDPTLPFENKAMEAAAKTWRGAYWKYGGGGGTPWDGMAYDPDLDLLYVGTGNGAPWPRDIRSPGGGDNLYLSSILALRPETGEYVWHFQETPGDSWDYASTPPLVLADVQIGGRTRKVIMHSPKNGFFYVIDRTNGRFISGAPIAKVTWASGLDPKTGRPIETPEARYGAINADGTGGTRLYPGSDGAHNWHAMSWNPSLGLMYIPGQETSSVFSFNPDFEYQLGRNNTGRLRGTVTPKPGVAAPLNVVGETGHLQQEGAFLVAWDPVAEKERWRIRFEKSGITGGALATGGGLVFHGSNDGVFSAYSADAGKRLWSMALAPGFANPITYELDGRQYVMVATGRSGAQAPGRLYAFALDGKARLPSMAPKPEPAVDASLNASVAAEFDRAGLPDAPGRQLMQQLCSGCHLPTVVMQLRQSEAGWRQTVAEMGNRGAPGTPDQREAIIKYLAAHLPPSR